MRVNLDRGDVVAARDRSVEGVLVLWTKLQGFGCDFKEPHATIDVIVPELGASYTIETSTKFISSVRELVKELMTR